MIIPISYAFIYSLMAIVFIVFYHYHIDANGVSLSCSCHCLHTVHGFEERLYTTDESEALQGINFHPNVKGTGQPVNIGIIYGTIVLEEDTASKLFLMHYSLNSPHSPHYSTVGRFKFQASGCTSRHQSSSEYSSDTSK